MPISTFIQGLEHVDIHLYNVHTEFLSHYVCQLFALVSKMDHFISYTMKYPGLFLLLIICTNFRMIVKVHLAGEFLLHSFFLQVENDKQLGN